MTPFPETLCKFRMFSCNTVMHFLTVFFQSNCQGFFIFSGNIDNFFEMLFQMFQPLILIQILHMRPSAVKQIFHITSFLQLFNLTPDLSFDLLFCLTSKRPDKFLHPVVGTFSGRTALFVIHTAL